MTHIGTELAPGLSRWTAIHPSWKEEVGCLAVDTADGLVLIDPLLGDDDVPQPRHILLTVHWHVRSTAAIAGRSPDTRVWAAPREKGKPLRGHATPTDVFLPGDELPGGIQAYATARGPSEVVFWLPGQRALAVGDVLLGTGDGGLRLCPRSWLPRGTTQQDLAESLRPLLDLPVERVLVSHGDPVLTDARGELERALD